MFENRFPKVTTPGGCLHSILTKVRSEPLSSNTACSAVQDGAPQLPGLVMSMVAIENGPIEIVGLPIHSMVIFHSYFKLSEGMFVGL